jgi:hypothetical protein
MRSSAGVGITPPKVLGAANPLSSVMISSTLGAPLGGTTRGGHQALDSDAFSLIIPPNFGSGGGSCLPLIVVVALGAPSSPVTCCASTGVTAPRHSAAPKAALRPDFALIVAIGPPPQICRCRQFGVRGCGPPRALRLRVVT